MVTILLVVTDSCLAAGGKAGSCACKWCPEEDLSKQKQQNSSRGNKVGQQEHDHKVRTRNLPLDCLSTACRLPSMTGKIPGSCASSYEECFTLLAPLPPDITREVADDIAHRPSSGSTFRHRAAHLYYRVLHGRWQRSITEAPATRLQWQTTPSQSYESIRIQGTHGRWV